MLVKTTGLAPSGRALTVMVKLWAVPTSFTPLGVIEMLASTYFFTAGPLLPWVPSVARVTVTPPMVTWAEALAVKLPAEPLLMVRVQVAVLLTMVGATDVVLWLSGAGLPDGVMLVKTTGLAPSGRALTVMVKVWAVPTSFTPLGVIEMLASTYFFIARAHVSTPPTSARRTPSPPLDTWAEALAGSFFAEALLMVRVQVFFF